MQKQELNSSYFLAIQATYEGIEFALCDREDILTTQALHKFDASRLLISTLDKLLSSHRLAMAQLNFIAVNQGPGPFTTLRTVLATVNGLSYASGVPLIGVDGLMAFIDEVHTNHIAVVILNAFNHDVYYAIKVGDTIVDRGCKHGAALIAQLKSGYVGLPILCVGNGVELWQSGLEGAFNQQVIISDPMPHVVSIGQIAAVALRQWQAGDLGNTQLMPIYLKQYSATLF